MLSGLDFWRAWGGVGTDGVDGVVEDEMLERVEVMAKTRSQSSCKAACSGEGRLAVALEAVEAKGGCMVS